MPLAMRDSWDKAQSQSTSPRTALLNEHGATVAESYANDKCGTCVCICRIAKQGNVASCVLLIQPVSASLRSWLSLTLHLKMLSTLHSCCGRRRHRPYQRRPHTFSAILFFARAILFCSGLCARAHTAAHPICVPTAGH